MGNEYMRDLLHRFSEKNPQTKEEEEEVEELNLGLSLGGLFGAKPKESSNSSSNNLYRSSSNACYKTFWNKDDDNGLSLTRTSSLPVETEEETRKRKGCQIVKQMEVMKKRSENNKRSFVGDKKWVKLESSQQEMDFGGRFPLPLSQGSIGSQGSASSGISELDNQSAQGTNISELKGTARVLSLRDQKDHTVVLPYTKPVTNLDITSETEIKNSSQKPSMLNSCSGEFETKVMEEMPCVSTKGDGPNGKRIEGLLFKYKKGEEVRIVCVCHGTFLTPAEFVKHAGGGDVAHPLRHIVMSSRSSCL